MAPALGTPVGLEIPARDVARGAAFYAAVFNWTFAPSTHGLPKEKVLTFETPGGILPVGGALVRTDEEIPSGAGRTKIYLYVEDLEAAQKAIEGNGGKLVSKVLPEGNIGRFQYIEDSEGNALAIYSYLQK